ncbi:mitochondrial inner membrane protease subunit 1 [Agrilus planipennis]|uniref:Mitochondrial inner membrane protease subunit n=1 Tax=Agrilus planipennis TaxID=224129 RepID=A0A1W4X223_AGRPL|nr:mitochondrial inner membrane protease subunit 1 [Agrilus planipennis]
MRPVLRKIIGSVADIVKYACIVHCTLEYVGDFVICSGPSMEPTLHTNDVLLTEHFTPRLRDIKRGDILIVKCPTECEQLICKRVTALPGDKVQVGYQSSVVIPMGHMWLEGDNYFNSLDSRSYGPVPQGLVRGRALMKVWPFSSAYVLK